MKRILLFVFNLILLLLPDAVISQRLWNTTLEGGEYDRGSIFSIDSTGSDVQLEYSFKINQGRLPNGSFLTSGPNNLLYGLFSGGGEFEDGVLFRLNPITLSYEVLHSFEQGFSGPSTDGASPRSGLLLASNGLFYGMTYTGGANEDGTIFSFDPQTNALTILHEFESATGKFPQSALFQLNNDTILGTTGGGGSFNMGVLFRYTISTGVYEVIENFGFNTGANGVGKLIKASDGNVYGSLFSGGPNNRGAIYQYNPQTNSVTYVHAFSDGKFPNAGLFEYNNSGKLYGLTREGGLENTGILYEYNINTQTFTKKHDIVVATSGAKPRSEFIEGINGTLLATCYGNFSSAGTIIEYDPQNNTLTEEFDFLNVPFTGYYGGSNPIGTMCELNGRLYGICELGGTEGEGSIYEYDENTGTRKKLINNNGPDGGDHCHSKLVQANNGKFYATTHSGGLFNEGILFEFDPDSSTFRKLVDFNTTIGIRSQSELLVHSNGNLYGCNKGMAQTPNWGNVFEYDLQADSYTVLHSFDGINGGGPVSGLIEGPGGVIYGSTVQGGLSGDGVVFKYDLSSGTYTALHNFNESIDGFGSLGTLAKYNNDVYYGVTTWTPTNITDGTIFSYDIASDTFVNEYHFNSEPTLPSPPTTTLFLASDSLFYGVTGGSAFVSSIFKFDPSTASRTHISNLNLPIGTQPKEVIESNGSLIFVCTDGGSSSMGTILTMDLQTELITKTYDFDGSIGSQPATGFLLHTQNPIGSNSVDENIESNVLVHPNPFRSSFRVYNLESHIGSQYAVVDIYGRTVVKGEVVEKELQIDLHEVGSGSYVFQLKSPNSVITQKIIKTN